VSSDSSSAYGDPQTRARILDVTWELIAAHGARLKLSEVAGRAGVSRQALYLHFGDRTGLLVALVDHMDTTLELGPALTHVMAAPTGEELLDRAMRLNTEFWTAVAPVANVLQGAQHDEDALGAAWRDRMTFRLHAFAEMTRTIADMDELAEDWTVEDAAAVVYAVAHFDTWRELTDRLGWSDDHYVDRMARMLGRSLLRPATR
jgi:AcrR family transcriptional regulator